MPIFSIYCDTPEDTNYEAKPLDGDFNKVAPLGFDFHPVAKAAINADGGIIFQRFDYQGTPVDTTHLPSRVMLGGPRRNLTALFKAHGLFLTSKALREVIEELEPGRHQFAPMELVWKDKTHAADYFWVYPCVRIDGMDQVRTTAVMSPATGLWQITNASKLFANRDQVGAHHLWVDTRLPTFPPFVSETFRAAAEKGGLKGIGYSEIPFSD
ncbi:DUF1629 domain-containing protein [Neorhizobium sp. JUb45]|uniref:imm11 family protein n=1 Tax=unclassified Neorhizobium TaxID=2629175 RepID=UPI00104ABDC8|nr:DUF1629 domain-containing protein [Neorhizobium sp. JUb45]TCR04271.1 hypothetical protein EDF70_102369 [Neorhizobium sp. JUb45]